MKTVKFRELIFLFFSIPTLPREIYRSCNERVNTDSPRVRPRSQVTRSIIVDRKLLNFRSKVPTTVRVNKKNLDRRRSHGAMEKHFASRSKSSCAPTQPLMFVLFGLRSFLGARVELVRLLLFRRRVVYIPTLDKLIKTARCRRVTSVI